MAKLKFQKIKSIPVSIQKYNFESKYKNIIKKKYNGQTLKYDIELQPTSESKVYRCKVIYESLNDKPKVYVILEDLCKRGDEKLPHNYGENGKYLEMCLWYGGDWKKQRNIADTIIPWASEWLYFYEYWYITGKWLGGGIEHIDKKKRERNDIVYGK